MPKAKRQPVFFLMENKNGYEHPKGYFTPYLARRYASENYAADPDDIEKWIVAASERFGKNELGRAETLYLRPDWTLELIVPNTKLINVIRDQLEALDDNPPEPSDIGIPDWILANYKMTTTATDETHRLLLLADDVLIKFTDTEDPEGIARGMLYMRLTEGIAAEFTFSQDKAGHKWITTGGPIEPCSVHGKGMKTAARGLARCARIMADEHISGLTVTLSA